MALVKCPECGNAVSTEAPACPSCGFPIAAKIAAQSKPSPDTVLAEVRPSWWQFFWLLVFFWLIIPWIVAWSRRASCGPAHLSGPRHAGTRSFLQVLSGIRCA